MFATSTCHVLIFFNSTPAHTTIFLNTVVFSFFFSCNYSSTVVYNRIKTGWDRFQMFSTGCCKDWFERVKKLQPDCCVQSGLSQKKWRFGPVAVHGCPFLEAKTGLNRTFIHYTSPRCSCNSSRVISGCRSMQPSRNLKKVN